MTRCTECEAIEGGVEYVDFDKHGEVISCLAGQSKKPYCTVAICKQCESEDSIICYDEDYGKER